MAVLVSLSGRFRLRPFSFVAVLDVHPFSHLSNVTMHFNLGLHDATIGLDHTFNKKLMFYMDIH